MIDPAVARAEGSKEAAEAAAMSEKPVEAAADVARRHAEQALTGIYRHECRGQRLHPPPPITGLGGEGIPMR